MEDLRQGLLPLVAPVAQRLALELIDLELKGSRHNLIVRAIVDTDGGVSLDACAVMSRALGEAFDAAGIIPGRYRLEVSSPGIDRPLRSERDFKRNLGREVVVHWRQPQAVTEMEGIIHAVSETEVEIMSQGEAYQIPLAEIEFGKIKIKW